MFVLIWVLVAYLVGSTPTGLLVAKIGYGVDIRKAGSGNIGATNVRRILGPGAGALVLGIDVVKGAAVVAVPAWIQEKSLAFPLQSGRGDSLLIVITAAAVILGNMFSIFIKGKGGKGVGVSSGVLFVMVPQITAILLAVWLIVRAATKYVSLASLVIAALFPALMWFFYPDNEAYLTFALLATTLVFFSHRANIKRLIAGEELKDDKETDKTT